MIDAEISAYSSEENQTDSTPYLTASQVRVREGIIACPDFLRFGQVVEINGRQYECQDVMNLRYRFKKNFDIWMASKEEALKFGRQQTIVKIYL